MTNIKPGGLYIMKHNMLARFNNTNSKFPIAIWVSRFKKGITGSNIVFYHSMLDEQSSEDFEEMVEHIYEPLNPW